MNFAYGARTSGYINNALNLPICKTVVVHICICLSINIPYHKCNGFYFNTSRVYPIPPTFNF